LTQTCPLAFAAVIWESEAPPGAADLLEVFFVVAVPLGAMELLLAAGDALGAGVALAAGALAGVEEVSAIDVVFLVFWLLEVEPADVEVEAMPPELPAPAGWPMVSLAAVLVFFDFLPDVVAVSDEAVVDAADVSVAALALFLLLDFLPEVDVVSEAAVVDAADVSVAALVPFLLLDFLVEVALALVELALEDESGVAV
jgi:hypothetical protein